MRSLTLLAALALTATASAQNQDLITDGSFEAGSPSTVWVETGTTFGTPICPASECADPAPGPRTGDWYAFFGGEGIDNQASISQTVTIPAGATGSLLTFYLQLGRGGDATGSFEFVIDGIPVQTFTEANVSSFMDYQAVNVDLMGFADGQPRTYTFRAAEQAGSDANAFMTFLLDDVSLVVSGVPPAAAEANDAPFLAAPIVPGAAMYTGSTADADPDDMGVSASCTFNGPTNDIDRAAYWYLRTSAAGDVTLDLDGSDFDTVLSVLVVGPDDTLTETVCNDDDPTNELGDFTSALTFTASQSTTYLVRVSGYAPSGTGQGAVALSVSGDVVITTAPGDERAGALGLLAGEGHPESTVAATLGAGEPAFSCLGSPQPAIWRRFDAPSEGRVTLSVTPANPAITAVALDVYEGSGFGSEAACDIDNGGAEVTFDVSTGETYWVRVATSVEGAISIGVSDVASTVDTEDGTDAALTLFPPAPNPSFGPIRLGATLTEAADVRVEVFDALGRRVAWLHDGPSAVGEATWTWHAHDQPAGVYVVRLTAGGEVRTQRVTVVR